MILFQTAQVVLWERACAERARLKPSMPDTLLLVAAIGYGVATLAYLGCPALSSPVGGSAPKAVYWCSPPGSAPRGAPVGAHCVGAVAAAAGARRRSRAQWRLAGAAALYPAAAPAVWRPLPAPLHVIRALAGALVIGLLLASVTPFLAPTQPVLTQWAGNLGLVLLSVMGLVLVEQVYRSTRPEDRWAIKFLCLGLGGLFVYDIYLYANAALFNAMDAQVWAARGYVAALVTPLIAISAARNPEWAAPVGLSRSMAFHTASLLGAGFICC